MNEQKKKYNQNEKPKKFERFDKFGKDKKFNKFEKNNFDRNKKFEKNKKINKISEVDEFKEVNENLIEDKFYIFGKNSVIEAIANEKEIQKIFVCFGSDNSRIMILAKKNKINCTILDKNRFHELELKLFSENQKSENLTKNQIKTQGVIALKQIVATFDLDEILSTLDLKKNPIIAILDEINDPQNLGAIARSAECAGVSALIIPERKSAPITPTAIKISAGALNYLPVIQVKNLILTIEKLKKSGFWVVGTDISATENYHNNIYDKPIALIIGNEGKGISSAISKHCDHLIKINLFGKINSLNASVASGIIFFEICRQRFSSGK
jgi:23S rRNA (guanosine2251-2'-O)-methyltransferase